MHFPTDRITHTTTFDGPVVDHWLEWKIAQTENASTMQDQSAMREDPNLYSRVLDCLSYVLPPDAVIACILPSHSDNQEPMISVEFDE